MGTVTRSCDPRRDHVTTDLELGVFSRVEAVHSTEALARRTSTQQLHLPPPRQRLARVIGVFTLVCGGDGGIPHSVVVDVCNSRHTGEQPCDCHMTQA